MITKVLFRGFHRFKENVFDLDEMMDFIGSSELSVGDRVLRVGVEVLDDERTCAPAVVKDLGRCLSLPAAALCRLIVVTCGICSLTWRVSIWLPSLGVSVVWRSI